MSLFIRMDVFAVPAYPYKVKVEAVNGKLVEIYMKGDEYQKYAISTDGYTLLSDSKGWWYAMASEDGKIRKSDYILEEYAHESSGLKMFKKTNKKGLVPERVFSTIQNRAQEIRYSKARETISGERRALVILMQFNDFPFIKKKEDFLALFNEIGYHENNANGSVRDYYRWASQGQLDYVSDVYGPYTSKYSMNYYGGNGQGDGKDTHAVDLCIEAVRSLPRDMDYSIYDNDGDGLIDNVHIIFAGYGEESGASSDAIWSHEYPHRIALKDVIGYSIAGYSCTPELQSNRGTRMSNIGVICHELGHALGAMDYYDTNNNNGGSYLGTGDWDIMAHGSWNDNGRTPANFNPYVRSVVFGWNSQKELKPNQQVVMPRMEIDNAEKTVIYVVETESDNDYFLLENRQQHGFDMAIPGSGLMIYHVHPSIDRYNSTNTVNATHPQGFYPVCASYSEPNNKAYGNINSSECPFPGDANIRYFSSSTSPAALAWDGRGAKISISNIKLNSSDGSISFSTADNDNGEEEPDNPLPPTELSLIYHESFESSLDSWATITSISGNNAWRTYKKGNFVINAEFIPKPTNGNRLLMLYDGNGSAMKESELDSPDIGVDAGQNYLFSFDIYSFGMPNSYGPLFRLYVEDEYGEYNIYSLNEVKDKWNRIEIPLSFGGNKFKYKLYGLVSSGGIFIDAIQLLKEEQTSLLSTHSDDQGCGVYRIDGSFVGKFTESSFQLVPGIYLIKKEGKFKKVIILDR